MQKMVEYLIPKNFYVAVKAIGPFTNDVTLGWGGGGLWNCDSFWEKSGRR